MKKTSLKTKIGKYVSIEKKEKKNKNMRNDKPANVVDEQHLHQHLPLMYITFTGLRLKTTPISNEA